MWFSRSLQWEGNVWGKANVKKKKTYFSTYKGFGDTGRSLKKQKKKKKTTLGFKSVCMFMCACRPERNMRGDKDLSYW